MDRVIDHRFRRAFGETLIAMRADLPLYLLALAYVAFGVTFVAWRSAVPLAISPGYILTWLGLYAVVGPLIVVAIGAFRIILQFNARRRLAFRLMFAPRNIGRFVAGTVLMMTVFMPFITSFSAIKSSLPGPDGFPYDRVLAEVDRTLHFGIDPWAALFGFARSETLLRLIETNYDLVWMLLWHSIFYWFAISRRAAPYRVRYIVSFMLVWIVVGNVFAGLFLSAGPAFYGLVTGDTVRYAAEQTWIATHSTGVAATTTYMAYLWNLYATGQLGIGSGISAFPSMHIAMVTLNAWVITSFSRRWGALAWAYVAIVLVSSVYLGWHYAIDGYAAILLSSAIYWGVRRAWPLLGRFRLTRPAKASPAGYSPAD